MAQVVQSSDSNCTVSATECLQAQDTHQSKVGLASQCLIATVLSLLLSTCKHKRHIISKSRSGKPMSDSSCTVSATEYLQAQDTHQSKVGLASQCLIATVPFLLLSTCKHMALHKSFKGRSGKASLAQSVSDTLPDHEVQGILRHFLIRHTTACNVVSVSSPLASLNQCAGSLSL